LALPRGHRIRTAQSTSGYHRGLATAAEALKLNKRVGDLKYLKEENFWGEKLRRALLLEHPILGRIKMFVTFADTVVESL